MPEPEAARPGQSPKLDQQLEEWWMQEFSIPFAKTSLTRADLLSLFPVEDVAHLTDADMQMVAKELGKSLTDAILWDDLELFASDIIEARR
jgi:hypothetical protein